MATRTLPQSLARMAALDELLRAAHSLPLHRLQKLARLVAIDAALRELREEVRP